MKAKKVTAADRKRMLGVVQKLKDDERNQVLADLLLFADRAIGILDQLTRESTLSPKEKKEIEDSISVGPQWLNYTRRVKRQKS
jgi:hypothetical protein